jgi:Trypsin-like peptidase domain
MGAPTVNGLDAAIVVFAVAMAAVGWERGLVRSALALAGFITGAAIGGRVGPDLLSGGVNSAYAPVAALVGGLLGGTVLASVLDAVGIDLRGRFKRTGALVATDGIGGAALLGVLALLVAWAFGAAIKYAAAPGGREARDAINGSRILSAIDDLLPPSGPILNLLRRVDPVPRIVGPSARVAPPNPAIVDVPGVRRAADSAVKVLGTACGIGLEGSGWVARRNLVVTNAHVIAGEDSTTVDDHDGQGHAARAVLYDPRDDLAILRVPGLGLPALHVAAHAPAGTPGTILGYPGNGALTASAARIGQSGPIETENSYGRGPIKRAVTPFRGQVLSGNSGSAVVDRRGRVLATVFAANESGPPGGLGVPGSIARAALSRPLRPTSTGPCG